MAGTTLGTAYVQIVPSAQGIKGSISNVLGGEAASAGESSGKSLGANIVSFAKKAIIAGAIGKVVKASLDEGAKLQQSYFGGLDTLYGEAADAARAYAREAAQAGISMNDYSEQAVSFGAALKNAFGGDVTKAAKAANTAIMDMADNSAKMGTDIESVQMAYQGFAKQNYTMLDNLKLGYGGTRTEMQRLLADAEKITGVKYDINNLGDVYEAIHVIQGELGLTGVAAAEASETFSGSFNAMKAAAANFLGSLAIGENVSGSLNTLIKTTSTFFFKNFIPMLGTIVKSIPGAVVTFMQEGFPIILSGISSLVSNLAASIASTANSLTSEKVAMWITTTLPKLLSGAATLIGTFAKGLLNNLPKIIAAIGQIATSIVTGLGSAIWGKITAAAQGIVSRFMAQIDTLKTKAKTAMENAKNAFLEPMTSFKEKVSAAAKAIKDKFMSPIDDIKGKVKSVIETVKGYFPFNLGQILHFSLPKISVSGGTAPWGIGGKGTPPSFNVSWASHAAGGIFTRPTLLMGADGAIHQVGEAGAEAILPLSELWRKMEEMQSGTNETNIVININGANKDPKVIAEEVKQMLIKETNQRRMAWQ